jgi:hypothetical protein
LTVQGDSISAQIAQVPLGAVLTELARQMDLTIYVTQSSAERNISVKFKALPLSEGIKQLLEGQNYMLMTAPILGADGKPNGSRVAQIRVLSQGEAYTTITGRPATEQASKEDDAQAQLKRDALEASEPEARMAALEALFDKRAEMAEGELAAIVVPALQDEAPEVRGQALGMLHRVMTLEEGLLDHLTNVAQTDTSPELRMDALQHLTAMQADTAQSQLQQTIQESPDPAIKKKAESLLSWLEKRQQTTEDDEQKASPAQQQ